MEVKLVGNPKTSPPDPDKAYVCVAGPDGKEQWLLLAEEGADGVTAADFDFKKGERWAAEQKKAAGGK